MIDVRPVMLEGGGIRLEPLTETHHDALAAAASDGRLWELWFTCRCRRRSRCRRYVAAALKGQQDGHMLPWVVRDAGERRHHRLDALSRHPARHRPRGDRVHLVRAEPAAHVTSTRPASACCSRHAFETLGCKVVGLRTDSFNFRSQKAIEALGAKKDGVIRHLAMRRDGTVRDTVMYSILAAEWPDVRQHLELRLARHASPGRS